MPRVATWRPWHAFAAIRWIGSGQEPPHSRCCGDRFHAHAGALRRSWASRRDRGRGIGEISLLPFQLLGASTPQGPLLARGIVVSSCPSAAALAWAARARGHAPLIPRLLIAITRGENAAPWRRAWKSRSPVPMTARPPSCSMRKPLRAMCSTGWPVAGSYTLSLTDCPTHGTLLTAKSVSLTRRYRSINYLLHGQDRAGSRC